MTAIQLVGQDKALKTLRTLSTDLQSKGVKSSIRVAAKPVTEAMKGAAPDDSKTPGSMLREGINITAAKGGRKIRTGTGDRVVTPAEGEVAVLVGPNKAVANRFNKSRKLSMGFIGWFLERGAKAHKIGDYRNRRLANRIIRAGLDPGKYGQRRVLKFGGRFALGPIPHPGVGAKRWMESSLASSQGRIETAFYTGLQKWVDKNGR